MSDRQKLLLWFSVATFVWLCVVLVPGVQLADEYDPENRDPRADERIHWLYESPWPGGPTRHTILLFLFWVPTGIYGIVVVSLLAMFGLTEAESSREQRHSRSMGSLEETDHRILQSMFSVTRGQDFDVAQRRDCNAASEWEWPLPVLIAGSFGLALIYLLILGSLSSIF